jgi:HSP20 family protein
MLPANRNGSTLVRTEGTPFNRLAPLFSGFFDDFFTPVSAPTWSSLPLCLWQDENHLYIEMDAPGVTEKDIDLTFHEGDLIIQGERKGERKEGAFDNRTYGRFEQRITLPSPVDFDKVEAKLANGVLSITFPKSEEAKPRKIALKS